MKSKDLLDAIGSAKDEYIRDAKQPMQKKQLLRPKGFYSGIAALLAFSILLGSLLLPQSPWFVGGWGAEEDPLVLTGEDLLERYRIGTPRYPEMVQYPQAPNASYEERQAWRACINDLNSDYKAESINLNHFLEQSIPVFLSGQDGENMIYSPLNVYMALAMLAETTDGNSRAQILELLDVAGVNQLRREASAIWKANYLNDGVNACLLANSLWLRDDWAFQQETVSILSQKYYASVFRGEMGSDDYNVALRDWMNEQTGGLLKDQIDDIEMDPSTVLALVSTVWFEAAWETKFYNAGDRVFHSSTQDVEVPFIENGIMGAIYSEGDRFSALEVSFKTDEASIAFILPEEGDTAENLLSDPQLLEFIIHRNEWEGKESVYADLSLPKFDVSSQINLKDGLMKLGITDVFDYEASDFSPITTESNKISVDNATHGARVQLDENGCIATAYTIIAPGNGSAPKYIEFVADRPFLFVIYSPSDLPLFVGIVNQPQ